MIKLGVVGVGVIASAVVKGLKAKYGDELAVTLSPRNARRAEALGRAYANTLVAASNQEVLDASEWVVISVLPGIAEETVRSLRFRQDHRVISLVSKPKIADLSSWIGECRSITRVNPLPFMEFHVGPVLVHPRLPEALELFAGLGDVIPSETEDEFILGQTLSCAMGPFYYLLDQIVLWMRSLGMSPERSAAYLESLFPAMSRHAAHTDPNGLDELWKEMTPGGLNENAIAVIKQAGGFDAWIRALDAARERIA